MSCFCQGNVQAHYPREGVCRYCARAGIGGKSAVMLAGVAPASRIAARLCAASRLARRTPALLQINCGGNRSAPADPEVSAKADEDGWTARDLLLW